MDIIQEGKKSSPIRSDACIFLSGNRPWGSNGMSLKVGFVIGNNNSVSQKCHCNTNGNIINNFLSRFFKRDILDKHCGLAFLIIRRTFTNAAR